MDTAQFRTILWLRWRLAVNQWTRNSGLGSIVATLLGAGATLAALSALATGILVGSTALAKASPDMLLVVWDIVVAVFLFFWIIGIASELQRSEIVDLPRLMHLPVSLREAFFINYLASHVTLSLIIVAPAMAGLVIGLTFARGPEFALVALPAFGLLVAVTAWTYCLRGWLSALMINARRKRVIIVWVTISVMLIAQAPNLYFSLVRDTDAAPLSWTGDAALPANLDTAHRFLPPLWVGFSARALANEADWLPALLSGGSLFLLAALGFNRAYRSTVRFYAGSNDGSKKTPPRPAADSVAFLERSLPGVTDEVAAVATSTLRCIARAPELKMALGSAIAMVIVFAVLFLRPGAVVLPDSLRPWSLFGGITLALMIVNQLYANQFGADRDGFRTYVLSPISGRDLLLGKNLALFPIILTLVTILLALLALVWSTPLRALVEALFQGVSATLLVLTAGNATSIFLPYHIVPGTLKPTKTSPQVMVALLLFTFILPVLLLPVATPLIAETILVAILGTPAPWIGLVGSPIILVATATLYWITLTPLGAALDTRQLKILNAVTHAVE
jgi:hypothetical protein